MFDARMGGEYSAIMKHNAARRIAFILWSLGILVVVCEPARV